MKKKVLSLFLVLILTAGLLLAGCSGKETEEGGAENTKATESDTVIIPVLSEISSFYTIGTGDLTGDILCANFDTLWTVKDAETVDYYVAKDCAVSEDGMEYTVMLNEGIKWHDGEELTADDLVFTITEADFMGYLPYFAGGPVTAEKVDDYTVKITLENPSNGFFQRLGTIRVMPEHCYKGVAAEELMTCEAAMQGIGMGPYKLVEWNQGESLVFEKNEEYYRGEVPYEKIVFRIMVILDQHHHDIIIFSVVSLQITATFFSRYVSSLRSWFSVVAHFSP